MLTHPSKKNLRAIALGAALLAGLAGCGGASSEDESRYLAAVSSAGLSDDAALQAGYDVCDDKEIDYISDLAARLTITGAALGYLCKP